jgi:hypothetical protein
MILQCVLTDIKIFLICLNVFTIYLNVFECIYNVSQCLSLYFNVFIEIVFGTFPSHSQYNISLHAHPHAPVLFILHSDFLPNALYQCFLSFRLY